MGEAAMACQLRLTPSPWRQARLTQLIGDRLHHQLMYSAVLLALQLLATAVATTGGAGQRIAAQAATPNTQQPLR